MHKILADPAMTPWRAFGGTLLAAFTARGLEEMGMIGDAWTMRCGEPAGEWWFLALERSGPRLVESGRITQQLLDDALARVCSPGLSMMSGVSIGCRGRKPA